MFQCVGIRTYSNRNIIMSSHVSNCNIVTQLKTMLSVNPKEEIERQVQRFIFSYTICDKITAVAIQIFSGLSLELVEEIINVVENYNFVNHVAFVLGPDYYHVSDKNNIKSIICASAKCAVYNNENEANTAAFINSRLPFFSPINTR